MFFWFFERIKSVKADSHYKAIKRINENHDSTYAIAERKKYLSQILQHTVKTVPYYRTLEIKKISIDSFPVVDKNLIRQHTTSFLSDTYKNKKTFKASTSGSTGTPFTVLHDVDKKRRHKADLRFYWESVNHTWGNKLYYMRIWTTQNRKNRLTQYLQNIIPIDVFKLCDQNIKKLLNSIVLDTSPKSILSYSSGLDTIVKYLKRYPTDMSHAGIISVIAMSESLDSYTKKYLEEHFHCPVVSRYANTENGMLAQQIPFSGNHFLANLASFHIEIFDICKDVPAKNGQMGRIVVTDLFNRAMPLIRYDTGDLGMMQKSKKNGKTQFFLSKVEGRKMDAIFATDGEPVSSFILTNTMWKYDGLRQYQFIQQGQTAYEFLLNTQGDFLREEELINEFKGYLGADASIKLTYIDEIPLLSSGKRKKVLNHSEKNNYNT